jgi:hypothetical protein
MGKMFVCAEVLYVAVQRNTTTILNKNLLHWCVWYNTQNVDEIILLNMVN